MKNIFLFSLLFLITLSAAVTAQVLVSVEEKTVCGDGIREGHEMCEPNTGQDLCGAAGKILRIAMVCDERDCSCLPKRMDCGNGIREGAEWCDPGTPAFHKESPEKNDFCPQLGALFNETFTCDPDTCLCRPETVYGVVKSVCGDGNITGSEECEQDSDCRADQYCRDCMCIISPRNVTDIVDSIKKNLTAKPAPEEKPEEKKITDYHGFVGAILPDYLRGDFGEAKVNVYVQFKNSSMQVVGIITKHGVVQDIKDEKLSGVNFDVFVEESKAVEILEADNQGEALKKAFDTNRITYKHKGIFSRLWAWMAGLFS